MLDPSVIQKLYLDPFLIPKTNIDFRYFIEIKVKDKPVKCLEYNIRRYFPSLLLRKDTQIFLKSDKFDYIKIENHNIQHNVFNI